MTGVGHRHTDSIERPARASRSAERSSTGTISGQPGPQTDFLRSSADICVYGGAAGGGKTVGLILEPLRHATRVANFTAVFFRRTTPQITNPGGLWDESQEFYPRVGGTPHVGMREWRWPRGGKIKFSHLQFDSTVYDWQGAQITLICFDELTHFTAHQFFYMVSRNRSTRGVRPYIRATCNPDADSWVADFLVWWIDAETGLPIPERASMLRHYVRVAEKTIWADRPEELVQYLPQPEDFPPSIEPPRPISVTFIPATVFNNPILLRANPEYYAWLLSLPTLERERLLGGNWKIRPAAGLYFKREWCAIVDEVPADLDVARHPTYRSSISLLQHPAHAFVRAGPGVRIRFPPPASLVRTVGKCIPPSTDCDHWRRCRRVRAGEGRSSLSNPFTDITTCGKATGSIELRLMRNCKSNTSQPSLSGVEGIPPNFPSPGSTWNEPGVSPVAGLTFAVIPSGGLSIGRRMSFPSRGASAPRSKRPKIEVVIKRRNFS